jgi:hypothetical protein
LAFDPCAIHHGVHCERQAIGGQRPSQGKQVELPAHQALAGDRRTEGDEGLHLSSIVAASEMARSEGFGVLVVMCSRVA